MNQRQRTRKLDRRRSHNKLARTRESRIAASEEFIRKFRDWTKEALIDYADNSEIVVRRSWTKSRIMDTIAAELRRRVRTTA